jgi:hypothetical protein
MSRFSNLSRPGWLVLGAVGVLILAPSAAIATSTGLTQLVGSGGQHAAVTSAGQLTTAQAAPSSFEIEFSATTSSSPCVSMPVISKTEAFVVTEIAVDTYDLPSAGSDDTVDAFHGAGCGSKNGFLQLNPATLGMTTVPVSPGYAIPKNGSLSFEGTGGTEANIDVFGYKVPARDATRYTNVVRPAADPMEQGT